MAVFVELSNYSVHLFPITLVLVLGAAALAGLADDLINLPVTIRIPLYFILSSIIARSVVSINKIDIPGLPALSIGLVGGFIFSAFFIAWYTNLFNFMDGIDGISGATAVVMLSAFSIVFFSNDSVSLGVLTLAIVGATIAFLLFNYPSARTFMGDSGSIFLGMAIGSTAIISISSGYLSMPAAFLLILTFAFDATVTLCRRLFSREHIWEAHHDHVYQQLCELGVKPQVVTFLYAAAAIIFSSLGILFDRFPSYAQILIWWLSISALAAISLATALAKYLRQKENRLHDVQGADS